MIFYLSLLINVLLLALVFTLKQRIKENLVDYENMVGKVCELKDELRIQRYQLKIAQDVKCDLVEWLGEFHPGAVESKLRSDLRTKKLKDADDGALAMKPRLRS